MQFFSQVNQEMQLFLIAVLSLVVGSFVSFITYRLGNSKNLLAMRSICTNCGCELTISNLIPIFSYFFQKGKCSNCNCKISFRYPAIELSFLISFLTVYFVLGREINIVMLLYFAIATILLIMSIIDLEHYFIPNWAQYILATLVIILLMYRGGNEAVLGNVKAAFLYTFFGLGLWVFFYFGARIEAIGVDDIKFFFIAGLLLGQKNFLSFMILCGVFGMLFGALWQKIKKDETFPFAPALCISAFICLLFDKKIDPVDFLGSLLFFQSF